MDEWDEPDATEAGRLFVAKLLDEIDCLRRELYDMQYTIRIEKPCKQNAISCLAKQCCCQSCY